MYATFQTTQNAADWPQHAETGRRETANVVSHRHRRVQVQTKVSHGSDRHDDVWADDEALGRDSMTAPGCGTPHQFRFRRVELEPVR